MKTPLKFSVCEQQPVRGDAVAYRYDNPLDAERAARRWVKLRKGEISIWTDRGAKSGPELVAVVLHDALDRVWTQVAAAPGQQAFL